MASTGTYIPRPRKGWDVEQVTDRIDACQALLPLPGRYLDHPRGGNTEYLRNMVQRRSTIIFHKNQGDYLA
jgi:hypothetical protein